MSCESRSEYILIQKRRYRRAGKACKTRLLDELRKDIALQTAVGADTDRASAATLCRFENRVQRKVSFDLNALLAEQFIASHKVPPKEIILDFDATDDVVHGNQEGRFFHGYYDHYCFLPLYVFCDSQLLCAYLRPSKIDGAKHAWAILALLIKRVATAGCKDHLPRRQRLLPLENAALVRIASR